MFSVSAQHFRQAFVQHGQTPHPTPRPHPRLPGHHGGPQRTLEEHASGGHQGSSCRPSLHLPQKRGETNHLFSSSASCVLSALAPNTADGLPRTDSLVSLLRRPTSHQIQCWCNNFILYPRAKRLEAFLWSCSRHTPVPTPKFPSIHLLCGLPFFSHQLVHSIHSFVGLCHLIVLSCIHVLLRLLLYEY